MLSVCSSGLQQKKRSRILIEKDREVGSSLEIFE